MGMSSCPKCQSEDVDSDVCTNCGIDVKDYDAKLNQQREENERRRLAVQERLNLAREDRKQANRVPIASIAVGLVVGLIGLLLFLPDSNAPQVRQRTDSPASDSIANNSTDGENSDGESNDDYFNRPAKKKKISKPAMSALALRLSKSHPSTNTIEEARNATVFIQTSTGSGSGFIIDASCKVITNRHVVDTQVRLSDVLQQAEFGSVLSQRSNAIEAQLSDLKTKYKKSVERLGERNIKTLSLAEKIEKLERKLANAPNKLLDEYKSATGQPSGSSSFNVSLVDGSSYDISWVDYSDTHDLAMFSLPEQGCPYLKVGAQSQIAQGTKVYTIGSPSGLTYTVTSGIFSGYRREGDYEVLQTDAPINPGNSGGPLITQDGNVIGINTAILRGTEGIGFSLPIRYALDDFNLE